MSDEREPHHYVSLSGHTYSAESLGRTAGAQLVMGWPEPTDPEPDEERLEVWTYDSVCEATDGCTVEPDGICEHGHPSWLLAKGLI